MPQNILLKAKGLYSFANQLSSVPEGSLLEANNIVINRDGIIESRRGFSVYGTSLGGVSGNRCKQLMTYKDRILRHYGTTLEYDNGSGTFTSFSGSISETTTGLRIKSIEANGNLYFTTSDGIKKISVSSVNDLTSATVTNAGGIKALDGTVALNSNQGFFTQDSAIAYRVVWGIKDANNNLILGTPSERIILQNPIVPLLLTSFNGLLTDIDSMVTGQYIFTVTSANATAGATYTNNTQTFTVVTTITGGTTLTTTGTGAPLGSGTLTKTSGIGDATITFSSVSNTANTGVLNQSNYYSTLNLAASATASDTKIALQALSTKLDGDIIITENIAVSSVSVTSNVATLTFASSVATYFDTGDYIKISGFTLPNSIDMNGYHKITNTPATTITFNIDHVDFGAVSETATVQRLKYTIENFRVNDSLDIPVKTIGATIKNQRGYIQFAAPITSYLTVGDLVTISGFTGSTPTDLTILNGTSSVVLGIQKTTTADDTIQIGIITSDGAATLDSGGKITLEKSTKDLTLSDIPTTEQLESLQTYYNDIVAQLITEPDGIINTAIVFNPENAVTSSTADVTITIPDGVSTAHFYQLYRSPLQTSSGPNTLVDVGIPSDELNLVFEANPTNSEITAKTLTINDITSEDFRNGGTPLYTNPNSGEGIAQANEVPPLAKDITSFKNYTFYANTQTKQRKEINLLGVVNLIAGTSSITIGNAASSNTYTFDTTENVGTSKVLLSTTGTPSQNVDETARSLVRVINKTSSSFVNAFYVSGINDLPGRIVLENKTLSSGKFYVYTNEQSLPVAASFNPDLRPISISAISIANPTVVTTTATHNLTTGQQVLIVGTNSTPVINGVRTITVTASDKFSVPVNVTVAGTAGTIAIETSDNEVKPNRLYYSKVQQPEAVPSVNYIPVGPEDKRIVRIMALRDGLFILKEEGIYRLSGDVAPFTVTLFDSTTEIVSDDSAVALNNQIYLYANQGISRISDTGVEVVSRNIENLIIKLISPNYSNFNKATFGVAYSTDRSYYLYTVSSTADTNATQCFRYNTFTGTWSIFTTTNTCGIVNPMDDKLYLGAGDINYIEKERKDFSRTDYSDREYTKTILTGSINNTEITLNSITDIEIGDSLVQTQYLTIYQYNRLLKKLDMDSGITTKTYYSSLAASAGDDLRSKLDGLAARIDTDLVTGGTYAAAIVGFTSSFIDTQLAYNAIVNLLNASILLGYNNYPLSSGTVEQEIDIVDMNSSLNKIYTRYSYPFISGPITLFKHINTSVIWAPQTMEDPSLLKQVREATLLFENNAFYSANFSFASDLSPDFESNSFPVSGVGIFGSGIFGDETTFGGLGTSVPFRTYIPRSKQRCRYIKCGFSHGIARENFSIYGLSLTFEMSSTRGYK